MFLKAKNALYGLIISALIVIALTVVGVDIVIIPNAFFMLAAITVFAALLAAVSYALIYKGQANTCSIFQKTFKAILILSLLLLLYVILLSVFVILGFLALNLLAVWIGLFLVITILIYLLDF